MSTVAVPGKADVGARSARRRRVDRAFVEKLVARLAFLATALAIWAFAAAVVAPEVIPTIGSTFSYIWELLSGGYFYEQLGITARRVLLGFGLAYAVALVIGIAMGRIRRVEAFFEMWIIVGTSQPGLFVAMILLVALGLQESTAVLVLAYLATPIITVSIWQAAKHLDTSLAEVAGAFNYPRWSRIRHVILPQMAAAAFAGVRQGLGITWKYVVMIEMIGLTDGVGHEVTKEFQLFDLRAVVAWTLCFLAFVLLLEYAVIRRLERRAVAWRDRGANALAPLEVKADG
jgi:NitT/TauT family transport system permease protein